MLSTGSADGRGIVGKVHSAAAHTRMALALQSTATAAAYLSVSAMQHRHMLIVQSFAVI
jgi:phosphotransacetylase